MVSSVRNIALPWGRPWEQEASREVEDAFIARARALGVEVTPLEIGKPARVFPWITRNQEFFRVSWRRKKSLSLLGLMTFSWTKSGSGVFRKHPVARVLMPLEGERAAVALRALPEVREMVVLEERTIDPILAVRVAGRWYEAYRWWESPHLLPDDCPLIAATVNGEKASV